MAADTKSDDPTLDLMRAKARLFGIEVTPERAEPILSAVRHLHDAVEQLNRFVAGQEPSTERHR